MPKNAQTWREQHENLQAARLFAEFLDLQEFEIDRFQRDNPDFILMWFSWKAIQKQFREVWDNGFPQSEVLQVLSSNDFLGGEVLSPTGERQPVAQYQQKLTYKKALLFLFTDSWRAKICKECTCKRHFIANHSRSECCSVQCSADYRTQYKADRHKRVKKKVNARRRREYAAKKKSRK